MNSPLSQNQQQSFNQRLVNAAATEKLSSNRKKSSHQQAREIYERDGSCSSEEREMVDDSFSNEDLLVRCNITVVTDNFENRAKVVDGSKRIQKTSSGRRVRKIRTKRKKSVQFHKYDEVIYADVTEYVYSLHDLELEHEKANRDLVDDIEGVVGDVGYFLRCLKEGIQEEATKSLRERRRSAKF